MARQKSRSICFSLIFVFLVFFSSFSFAFPTVQELDAFWDNRQQVEGQKKIIQFIAATEKVPQDFEIAWRVARLVYFTGLFGAGKQTLTKKEHQAFFKYGYEAANLARILKPERVEGYYWYAVNIGFFGMIKGVWSALKYAGQARDSLVKAAEIDPSYHWGGPYRVLGHFYQKAPSVISFGNKQRAAEYFKKALEISPDFRLNLIDFAILKKEQGDLDFALALLKKAQRSPKLDGELEEQKYLGDLSQTLETLKQEEAE